MHVVYIDNLSPKYNLLLLFVEINDFQALSRLIYKKRKKTFFTK